MRFPGSTPSNAPSNGFTCLKTIKYKLHIKTGTLVILCTRVCVELCCVLLCVGIVMGGGVGRPPRPLRIHPSDSAPLILPFRLSLPPLLLPLRLGPLSFSPSDPAPLLLPFQPYCRYEGMDGGGEGGA
jgi:hypothetical protein